MSLLLIRHGETALNVARVLQPADTPLSERGLQQATALAARLAAGPDRIASIVSSDLPRARQTAEAIAAATGAPLELSALWQERNFGAWRGLPYDGMGFDPLSTEATPPDGESQTEFAARIATALADSVGRYAATMRAPGEALVVVTHGLVLRLLLERHIALPEGVAPPFHVGNTSLTIIDPRPPHAARLIDCTRHLAPATEDDPHALSGG